MTYGTPATDPFGEYQVLLRENPVNVTDASATISVTMRRGESTATEAGLDALFQQLLDLLAGAPFLMPTGSTVEAYKSQGTHTVVTPTP